ncbi:endo-1,4-beta-xylanase [Actinophytocola gossypii]|uniref:endo-1,4-beta-xylanase n=1 Tax=Actinophytocola gossypii TaxID=2812003 RepID=UPI002882D60B|nr:endo-1,4-beta-xylanase [Actinophytocola gossypii]
MKLLSRHRMSAATAVLAMASGIVVAGAGSASAAPGCSVDYRTNGWGGGFTANLTVTNTGDPVDGWTLEFAFPGDQRITSSWNATWSQSGQQVSATNLTWNRSLGTGQSTELGFNATGGTAAPASFTVNGVECGDTDPGPDPDPDPDPSGTLRDHAEARGFLIGTALATGPLSGEASYRDIAGSEFNVVTAENAMKWDATEPQQGQFNFSGADQIMDFAEANGQTVHGHTLVWHNQTPGWVQNLDANAMRTAMRNHIDTVVGRYAGRIPSWDVVNEVFNENGGMRDSFWYQRLGESYIADAFRAARAADPNAELCINDYNVEGINAKSTAMYNLVSRLRGQGVPIDCVGIQGHLSIQYGFPNDLRQNIQRFADLGVDVKITELDVRVSTPADANELATQATYYRNVIDACLAVSRCDQLTVWGFTDKHSWVPDTFPGEGAALPYDQNYQPKPAYQALHDALAG